jgi:putative transcriptional regulator
MSEPIHHVPDAMLAASAAGALAYPFAVLVAAHVSLCDECRARLEAHRHLGGLVLEGMGPAPLSAGARPRTLAALHRPPTSEPPRGGYGVFPAPLADLLGHAPPRWRSLGFGAKQAILWQGEAGSVRLLSIPAGQAVADHGHLGLELTLVLSGAFADEGGLYRAGDIEIADEALEHVPRATDDMACICAAATDAPLRFRELIPRLLQPILRI